MISHACKDFIAEPGGYPRGDVVVHKQDGAVSDIPGFQQDWSWLVYAGIPAMVHFVCFLRKGRDKGDFGQPGYGFHQVADAIVEYRFLKFYSVAKRL